MTLLTADVVCRNSDSRCLLQLYQTTIWCNKQTHFFTLQLCFPLPGQLRCITIRCISCNCYFFREKWSKASFSSMFFGLFSSPHNDYTFFLYKKNVYNKMSLKNFKTLRKCSENIQRQLPELKFLKMLIFPKLSKFYHFFFFKFFFCLY